jgi:hypothetical protein
MDAFIGELHGAGAPQTLAGRADDGAAAFDPKIHCFTPVISRRFLEAATLANLGAADKASARVKMHGAPRGDANARAWA